MKVAFEYGKISTGVIVHRVVTSYSTKDKGVVQMSTFEAISVMIAFGTLIIVLLSYIDKRK